MPGSLGGGMLSNPGGMSWDQMMKLPREAQTTVLNNLQTLGGVTPGMDIPASAMGPQIAAQQQDMMRQQRMVNHPPPPPMAQPQPMGAPPMTQPPAPPSPMEQQAAMQKQQMQKPMVAPAPTPQGPAEPGLQGMNPGVYQQMAAALRAR